MSQLIVSLSIVVPVFQAAETIQELCEKIEKIRTNLIAKDSPIQLRELILVDDDSQDGSAEVISGLSTRYAWVNNISLSTNFGQHAATVAGIMNSSGDWIFTMDEDLQHDPSHLLEMLEQTLRSGSDINYAKPLKNVHGGFLRDASSLLAKRIIKIITKNPNIQLFNSFRCIRGNIARAAASLSAHNTYLDVTISWFSRRVTSTIINLEDKRHKQSGQSGYTWRKLVRHARTLLDNSYNRLFDLGGIIGFFLAALAAFAFVFIVTKKILSPESIGVVGWASSITTSLLTGGLSVLLLSILLRAQNFVTMHLRGKPLYFEVDRSNDAIILEWLEENNRKNLSKVDVCHTTEK